MLLISVLFSKIYEIYHSLNFYMDNTTFIILNCRRRITVQIFAVMGIAIGHILDGTVLAYPSPAIPSMFSENSTLKLQHEQLSFVSKFYVIKLFYIAGTLRGSLINPIYCQINT